MSGTKIEVGNVIEFHYEPENGETGVRRGRVSEILHNRIIMRDFMRGESFRAFRFDRMGVVTLIERGA